MEASSGCSDHSDEDGRSERATAKRRRTRNAALIVQVPEGDSYASVLKRIQGGVDHSLAKEMVKTVRQGHHGSVVVVLNKAAAEAEALQLAIAKVVGESAVKRGHKAKEVEVEVRDLPAGVTEDEVVEAVQTAAGTAATSNGWPRTVRMRTFRPGARVARVAVSRETQEKLLAIGRLKVGWASCRVSSRTPRCFRCLDYGHLRNKCTGEDKSGNCRVCGQAGHRESGCNNATCMLCSEKAGNKHYPGSGACAAYKAAQREWRPP